MKIRSTNVARAYGLILDNIFWYLIHFFMLIFAFLVVYQKKPFAGNLPKYREHFDQIMHEPVFITIFVVILLVLEIGMPLIFGGQSITKKIFHLKVEPFTVSQTVIRGFVKLIMCNPNGVISFILGCAFSMEVVNYISTFLGAILLINAIVVIRHKTAIHEVISRTHVVLEKE